MKLLYKPFSMFAGQFATRLGRSAFAAMWAKVGEGEHPPQPAAGRRNLAAVAGSAALEAATMAAAAAVVDQLAARAFHHLLGAWPVKPPEAE